MSELLDKLKFIKMQLDLLCQNECCEICKLNDAAVNVTDDECILLLFEKTVNYIKYIELEENVNES